jgi:hypothetical protein
MRHPEIREPVNRGKGLFLIDKDFRLLLPDVTERAFGDTGVCYGEFGETQFAPDKIFKNIPVFP